MLVGPNLYAYVRQNPWTSFDPDGLSGDFGPAAMGRQGVTDPEVQKAMQEADLKTIKGLKNSPRAIKKGIQNLPQLPGQLLEASKNPKQALENIKQAANETVTDPQKMGEFYGTAIIAGFFGKLLSRAKVTGAVVETSKDAAEGAKKLGDLTTPEIKQIQAAVDSAERPLEVVGSAATGTRRGVGTNLPIGKDAPGLPGTTRSDIDYLVPPSSIPYYKGLNLPSLDPKSGIIPGIHNPHIGPAIRFEPATPPYIVPRAGG